MLKYLAILDYLNNSHDEYEDGYHLFEYENGILKVLVDDEAITYELISQTFEKGTLRFLEVVLESGELQSVKQLRQLHQEGWKILERYESEIAA